jgi:predicted Ser/Thr protein kinase
MSEADHERWRRIGDLFAEALERAPRDRDRFLAEVAQGAPDVAQEVRALLASHQRATDSGFLERPAAALDADLLDDAGAHIGRRIGPYVIKSQIARGGMGVVFCAEDTRLGREVALKAIAPELASDDRMRERLRREARAAAALSHPAIATVYALEEADGELFIASEYVPGHTLREELLHGPLSPLRALETARGIAGALAAAHAHGIVHRDLKPENVVRRDDGQVKVLDFGLARTIAADSAATRTLLTAGGAVLGTPGYMAPEQLRGEPVDRRADVYAFGVLLHELVTGRRPLDSDLTVPSGALPSPLDAVIRRCLRQQPEQRFDSGLELLAALTPSGASPAAIPEPGSALWWWQFHQLAVCAFHSSMLVALWFARGWFPPPWGNAVFYASLAVETAAVTLRLHLWFSSRFRREILDVQRARVHRPLAALDAMFAALLFGTAAVGANADRPAGPLFVIAAVASSLALLLIEPATSRAAFDAPHS